MRKNLTWILSGLTFLSLNFEFRDQLACRQTTGILKTCGILLENDIRKYGVLLPATEAVFEKYRVDWRIDEEKEGYILKTTYFSTWKNGDAEVTFFVAISR